MASKERKAFVEALRAEGSKAYWSSLAITQCPYSLRENRRQWFKGFREAEENDRLHSAD